MPSVVNQEQLGAAIKALKGVNKPGLGHAGTKLVTFDNLVELVLVALSVSK